MSSVPLIQRLHELAPHLAEIEVADCPEVIGLLEQLKAQVWARLLMPQSANHDTGDDGLLDLAQVAKVLNITKCRAYELARQGHLPVVRIGKYVRMTRKDLTSYMEKLELQHRY